MTQRLVGWATPLLAGQRRCCLANAVVGWAMPLLAGQRRCWPGNAVVVTTCYIISTVHLSNTVLHKNAIVFLDTFIIGTLYTIVCN